MMMMMMMMMTMMTMTMTIFSLKTVYFSSTMINQTYKYRHMRCSIDTYVDSSGFTTSGRDDLSRLIVPCVFSFSSRPPRLLGGHRK